MSQGKKVKPEPTLWIPTTQVYAHIPREHFYEQLGRALSLDFIYELTKPLYAEKMGRPSLDPVVFFKCMLIGFFENIVYDTHLEFRIADSLTFRKFLGYSLEQRTPDESTLRKTRQKMPIEVFDKVFAYVLDVCGSNGLLKGRAIGTDSTQIDANASMDSLKHKELDCTYEEYVLALRRQDMPDATKGDAMSADKKRKGKASNRDWESTTDPESRVMQHSDGHTHLSYKVDTTVDLETGVIVSAGASFANISDQADFLEHVDAAREVLSERGMDVVAAVADKGHHSGENLAGIEERGLIGLVSSPNASRGAEGFRRDDFVYDEDTDALTCPARERLSRHKNRDESHRYYKGRGSVCRKCPHFGVCTKSRSGRVVSVSMYEDMIKANRERVHSEAARPLMMIRRQRGEAPFGFFKQFGGLRRFAGRGLEYASKKTILAAAGWNLLIVIKKIMRETAADAAILELAKPILALLRHVLELLCPKRTCATILTRQNLLRL
ncbi:MAG: IS1182 family transposase [Armatimonadota bacterium]